MIRQIDNGNLNTKTRLIDYNNDDHFQSYIEDLKDTLNANESMYYLCANQIGIDAQMFAMKFDDGCIVFTNPAPKSLEDNILSREQDFATRKWYIIPRASKLTMCYITEDGTPTCKIFEKDASALMCKLMDCLNGIQCSDFGLEVTEDFDAATEEEREEVIKAYIDQLTELSEKLDEDLSNNDDTKRAWTLYKFDRALALGEIELEETKKLNRKSRRLIDKLSKRKKVK